LILRRRDGSARRIRTRSSPTFGTLPIAGLRAWSRAQSLSRKDAVEVGSPQWLKDPADRLHVLGAEGVATLAERLGISDDTTVVAYDDYNGSFVTRLW
jgi:3-mercaptopyruvate sulfurtransferase SseA